VRAESSTEKTQITEELESLKSKLSALEAEKKKFETDILEKSSKITQLVSIYISSAIVLNKSGRGTQGIKKRPP
jgi:hypothetical protein